MSDMKTCGRCGAEMLDETAGGLCPRCLMALNFDSRTMPEGEAPPKGEPLSLPEMRERFPQFEVLECLGRGGMGVVYKARQKTLDRLVAIKVLAGEWQGEAGFATRFEKEAKILAQMSHPNIVTVHDFGEAGGLFYIVMEFIDGVNLRDLLREGKLEPKQALAIVPPICEALQYAHDKGIVHRDIKPENLLLDRDGRIKIADFGIAALIGASGENTGTPPYMAPEQSGDSPHVDSRADIYSLGVVFYEMLTGERPAKDVIAPSRKVGIDVRLDEIVLRALEKNPELRYQQASAIKTQVETIVSSPSGDEHESARTEPRATPESQGQPGAGAAATLLKSERARVAVQEFPGAKAEYPSMGGVALHPDRLVVSSGYKQRQIPLTEIRGLGEAVMNWWFSPAGHRSAGVDFDESGQRRRLAFLPGTAPFRTVADSRAHSAEWMLAIQDAVKTATGKEIPIHQKPVLMPVGPGGAWFWLLLLAIFGVVLVPKSVPPGGHGSASFLWIGIMLLPLLMLLPILAWRFWSVYLKNRTGRPAEPGGSGGESAQTTAEKTEAGRQDQWFILKWLVYAGLMGAAVAFVLMVFDKAGYSVDGRLLKVLPVVLLLLGIVLGLGVSSKRR